MRIDFDTIKMELDDVAATKDPDFVPVAKGLDTHIRKHDIDGPVTVDDLDDLQDLLRAILKVD